MNEWKITIDDAELMNAIELGYIYLKSCYVARECAAKALTKKDEKKELGESISFWNDKNYAIAENLAVLSTGYPSGTDTAPDCLPPTALECHSYNFTNHKEDQVKELLIPLYMKVTGQVRVRNDEETPVTDAVCSITCGDEETGSFEGTEDGSFSVYVPVMKPEEVLQSIEPLENMVLSFNFTSPTVEGEGSATAEFEPKGEIDLGTIYLENFDWYEYIRDELARKYGYTEMEPKYLEADRTTFMQYKGYMDWNKRSGIVSADIADFTLDGVEDLVLYRFVEQTDGFQEYHITAELYTRDGEEVSFIGNQDIGYFELPGARVYGVGGNTEYLYFRIGIVELDGRPCILTEAAKNDYLWGWHDIKSGLFFSTLTGWDGKSFCRLNEVGKLSGGSNAISYGFSTYDDGNLISKQVLWFDDYFWDSYKRFPDTHSNMEASQSGNCANAFEAVKEGYRRIGLPEAGESYFKYSDWDLGGGMEIFPSYWDTDTMKRSLEFGMGGEGDKDHRSLVDEVHDYTNLVDKIKN